jgi:hypothetical protein
MGKLGREAKHVTVGNLERGGRFGLWRTGRLGHHFWVVSGVIFFLVVLHAAA